MVLYGVACSDASKAVMQTSSIPCPADGAYPSSAPSLRRRRQAFPLTAHKRFSAPTTLDAVFRTTATAFRLSLYVRFQPFVDAVQRCRLPPASCH